MTGREEYYLGEDRGNPEAFAHMAIDAGASLVVASGPHVLRGMASSRRPDRRAGPGASPMGCVAPRPRLAEPVCREPQMVSHANQVSSLP